MRNARPWDITASKRTPGGPAARAASEGTGKKESLTR